MYLHVLTHSFPTRPASDVAHARTEARKLIDDAVISLRVSRTRPVHKRVAWCRSWRARRKSLAGPALMEIVDDERMLPRLAVIAAQMGMIGREKIGRAHV